VTQEKRAQIAKKIKALLARANDAASTESEMIMAAQQARKLQIEYNIDLTEADVLAEGFEFVALDWIDERSQFVDDRLCIAVSVFTATRVWAHMPYKPGKQGKQTKKGKYELRFYGLKGDAIFAQWLVVSLREFVMRAADWHIVFEYASAYTAQQQREAWRAFAAGACDRISRRLRQNKQQTMVKEGGNSTALVILNKQLIVNKSLEDKGIHITSKALTNSLGNDDDFYAGYRCGDKAGFNKPLNANDTKRIR
jgi:Protein of unknown function (DUF2786)